MKIFVLFIALLSCLTAHAQLNSQLLVQRYGANHPEVKRRIIEEVESIVSQCPYPYKEWSNGMRSYLGKTLYMGMGLIPKTNRGGSVRFINNFKVLDVTEEGCRIANEDSPENDLFVTGIKLHSGRVYSHYIFVRRTGDLTYPTVMGSSRTIPKYEYGTPISKSTFEKN